MLLFYCDTMTENDRCPTCDSDFICVKFRREKTDKLICPNCSDYKPSHFVRGLNGIFYEMSRFERLKNWLKDKPIRWVRRAILNRY